MRERQRTTQKALCLAALFVCLAALSALRASAAEDPAVLQRREIHLLIRDLGDKKPETRGKAEQRLAELGEKAAPDLILAVENRHIAVTSMEPDRNEFARARAARALGRIGGEQAAQPLIKALADRSTLVHLSAVDALGDMKCKAAVPELLRLSVSANPPAAAAAIRALGVIGDPSTARPLLDILTNAKTLKDRYKNDADVSPVRVAAAFALGLLGDRAAVPALLAGLRDVDTRVREHCDLALRKMSGRTVGFKADAPEPERDRAAGAWDAVWAAKESASPLPPQSPQREKP